jgi:succinoglycan biosynthesis transport protein ExoP
MTEKESHNFELKSPEVQYISQESEESQTDLRNYLLALLNRRWMILVVLAIVVIGVAIYSFVQTPVYQSKAVLDLDAPTTLLFGSDPSSQPIYWSSRESFINTEFRVLQSKLLAKGVAEKVILTPELLKGVKLPESETQPGQKKIEINQISTALLQMLSLSMIPSTNLCEIIFTTPSPKLSMVLANLWAEEYVDHRLDSMQEYTRRTEELLGDQVKYLTDEIAQKEKALHDYSLEKKIVKPDKTRSMAAEMLTVLNGALTQATQDRISAEVRYRAMQSANSDSVPEMANHVQLQDTRTQLSQLELLYNEKSKTYKPTYPEMVRIRGEIEQLRRKLASEGNDVRARVLSAAKSDYSEAISKERALQQQLEEAKRKSVEAGQKELSFDQLVMEIENKKQLLTLLLQKQNQTDVSAQGQQKKVATARVIEQAEFPRSVYKPNIKTNLLFSLLFGLMAGIALAFSFEYMDRSLKTPDDVERHLHLPFLGIVPQYSHEVDNGHNGSGKALPVKKEPSRALELYNVDLMTADDPTSSASEAMKTVRTALLLASPEGAPRSLLITSSRAGEGKTFIACNLAIALTQLDKRVVIVDADMRNPRIHRVWRLRNDNGLSIYLTNDVPLDSVFRPTPINRLTLIPSGPKTPRPAELLASPKFERMLEQLQNQFDFVILDSPPVLPVADSVILASRAKSVVMVVHGGDTPREVVKLAKRKLAASNALILGTILNGINLANPYYYYRYYSGYYYSYYGKNDPADGPPQS